MKILKILVFGLVALIVVLLGVGFFRPSEWKVQRSVTVDAPPAAVRAHVADLSHWPEWNPCFTDDPSATVALEGEPAKAGSVLRWKSEKLGDGSVTLTESTPAGVHYELAMKEFEAPTHGSIVFAPEGANGDRTRITWTDQGDVGGNPIMRLAVPLLEATLATSFDRGLKTLGRRAAESN